jgi:TROVE domain
MSRYNTRTETAPRAGSSPIKAEAVASGKTHEGGAGFARDVKSELFLRATSSFAGQGSFYEEATVRDDRLADLTAKLAVSKDGMAWLEGFLPWLRKNGFMRTAPVLIAAEAVHARLKKGLAGGNRQLIDAVLQRADEPGEFLAYWRSRFGRGVPMAVQRGVGDAAIRLYNEYGMLKYDTPSHGMRFGDVLEITHAGDRKRSSQNLLGPWQHDLFKFAIDRRHGRDEVIPESLAMVTKQAALAGAAGEDASALLDADALDGTGITWEKALSLAGKDADKAKVWESVIPKMGYMALLRNLRNFDEAGISETVATAVAAKLADPEQVAKSMQFPFRFRAAHREVPSLRWGQALEKALDAACSSIPALPGRSLILIDTSSSMGATMSGKSKMRMVDAAALFGLALGIRNAGMVDIWGYADGQFQVQNIGKGASVLKSVEAFSRCVGKVGHGTQTEAAVRRAYSGHDRVFIFTDGQTFGNRYYGDVASTIPAHIPVYAFNLAGYTSSSLAGGTHRHELGGLTDATFRMIPLIEMGQAAKWPWED